MSKPTLYRVATLFLAVLLVVLPAGALPDDEAASGAWWSQTLDRLGSLVLALDALVPRLAVGGDEAPAPDGPATLEGSEEPSEPPSGEAYPYLDPDG